MLHQTRRQGEGERGRDGGREGKNRRPKSFRSDTTSVSRGVRSCLATSRISSRGTQSAEVHCRSAGIPLQVNTRFHGGFIHGQDVAFPCEILQDDLGRTFPLQQFSAIVLARSSWPTRQCSTEIYGSAAPTYHCLSLGPANRQYFVGACCFWRWVKRTEPIIAVQLLEGSCQGGYRKTCFAIVGCRRPCST